MTVDSRPGTGPKWAQGPAGAWAKSRARVGPGPTDSGGNDGGGDFQPPPTVNQAR